MFLCKVYTLCKRNLKEPSGKILLGISVLLNICLVSGKITLELVLKMGDHKIIFNFKSDDRALFHFEPKADGAQLNETAIKARKEFHVLTKFLKD